MLYPAEKALIVFYFFVPWHVTSIVSHIDKRRGRIVLMYPAPCYGLLAVAFAVTPDIVVQTMGPPRSLLVGIKFHLHLMNRTPTFWRSCSSLLLCLLLWHREAREQFFQTLQ